ncbi:hypothetical protein PVBG_02755 [Plasmodium vivax Brazil I]|uniref:Uncharacterized protein n=1 Tax=Plasmodium vivax (strain Brazil I) TaxID=1033975 RepID=A0A0J9SVN2_PLAV1|nr:hypothetical protein PVBG_02755 [Plasmodium vivax Brazil I]
MENTFDYNQIDVDDFDDFYNFCTLKGKKKNGKKIAEQFFQTGGESGADVVDGGEGGEDGTDNSSVDTTTVYKEGSKKKAG